jgi:hypothetical protein
MKWRWRWGCRQDTRQMEPADELEVWIVWLNPLWLQCGAKTLLAVSKERLKLHEQRLI